MWTRGSEWGKWDLHVHTPASIINNYGPDDDATWERFIADLEGLPPEFKVLGINDYLFIDGYVRLRAAKESGRLKNIFTLIPVVELRVDKFGGTDGHLRRINMHVIFDETVDPKIIQSQFLNALFPAYELSAGHAGVSWSGIVDRNSLRDLGDQIIKTIPASERHNFDPPLQEGFNNLTIPHDQIKKALNGQYFRGRALTAVGKTEWSAIKWNDQSIADKKTLINSADIVFMSAESPNACVTARDSLKSSGVNHRLLDCSDAHWLSNSKDKDRVGKCFTWIKADPTFNGLKHALKEYADRVYLGMRPPKLDVVAANPSRFARRIRMRKVDGSLLHEKWFDCDLPLNADLVAIIGNKGSGKSALSDTLGLLGDTRNSSEASFLNPHKFRQAKQNKAREFEAELEWDGGTVVRCNLGDLPSTERPELIKYLPQNYLEKLCNEVATGEETAFDRELKATIFSHLQSAERLGKPSLDELITFKTDEVQQAILQLRTKLGAQNQQLLALEARAAPKHRQALEAELKKVEASIVALDSKKPVEVPAPVQTDAEAANTALLEDLRSQARTLQNDLKALKTELAAHSTNAELAKKLQSRLRNLKTLVDEALEGLRPISDPIGLDLSTIVSFAIAEAPVDKRYAESNAEIAKTGSAIAAKEKALADLTVHGRELQAKLKEPQQRRAQYLVDLQTWKSNRDALVGSPDVVGSLRHVQAALADLANLGEQVVSATTETRNTAGEILGRLASLAATYRSLYSPVQKFIDANEVVRDRFKLTFNVSVVENGFAQKFFDIINRQVTGSFCGAVEGEKMVRDLLATADFQTAEGALTFAERVLEHLRFDKRAGGTAKVEVATQLRKGHSSEELLNFLFGFSYLEPRYILRLGEKDLYQLSPGEKGLLLLIFYLLVDQATSPIVIDQPEENLDNYTIFDLLVPCVRAAKERRQVIIVTHNPNLAVVCDSEQIIAAKLDTTAANAVTYTAGSIENPTINSEIVRILEGTMPAFVNRDGKYLR